MQRSRFNSMQRSSQTSSQEVQGYNPFIASPSNLCYGMSAGGSLHIPSPFGMQGSSFVMDPCSSQDLLAIPTTSQELEATLRNYPDHPLDESIERIPITTFSPSNGSMMTTSSGSPRCLSDPQPPNDTTRIPQYPNARFNPYVPQWKDNVRDIPDGDRQWNEYINQHRFMPMPLSPLLPLYHGEGLSRMPMERPRTTPGPKWNGRNVQKANRKDKATDLDYSKPLGIYPKDPTNPNNNIIQLQKYYLKFHLNKNLLPEIRDHENEISNLCQEIEVRLAIGGVTPTAQGNDNADRWCLITSDSLEDLANMVMMIAHLLRNRLLKKGNEQRAQAGVYRPAKTSNKKKKMNFQRSTFKFLFDSRVDGDEGHIQSDLEVILREVESVKADETSEVASREYMNSVFPSTRDSIQQLYGITRNWSRATFANDHSRNERGTLAYLIDKKEMTHDQHLKVFFGDRWAEKDGNEECLFGIISEVRANPNTCLSVVHRVVHCIAKRNLESGFLSSGDEVDIDL